MWEVRCYTDVKGNPFGWISLEDRRMDRAGFLERVISLLRDHSSRFYVVGGQAVNAHAEPVVTLDLDIAVAVEEIDKVRTLMEGHFRPKTFGHSLGHSLNVSGPESDLRVQIQIDIRYGAFVERAQEQTVLGFRLPVASIEDVLQGKVWAVQGESRRPSKRQKDLADIARLLEARPHLRRLLAEPILSRLF